MGTGSEHDCTDQMRTAVNMTVLTRWGLAVTMTVLTRWGLAVTMTVLTRWGLR